jgi:hypothetical protein
MLYTIGDSHSGFNAVRRHLLRFRSAARPGLYAQSVGPLHTPRRVIDALLADEIDVGPLDGYALDLLRRHEPALAAALKVVATTAPAPTPLLVASASCPDGIAARPTSSLMAFGDDPACAALRETFVWPVSCPCRLEITRSSSPGSVRLSRPAATRPGELHRVCSRAHPRMPGSRNPCALAHSMAMS